MMLADFGLSIDATEERPVTRAGTLDYMAPEVCTASLHSPVTQAWQNCFKSNDIWLYKRLLLESVRVQGIRILVRLILTSN